MKNSIKRALSYLCYTKSKSIILICLMVMFSIVLVFSSVLNETLLKYQLSLNNKNGISVTTLIRKERGSSTTNVTSDQIKDLSSLDYLSDSIINTNVGTSSSMIIKIAEDTNIDDELSENNRNNRDGSLKGMEIDGLKLYASSNYLLDDLLINERITLTEGVFTSSKDEIVISNELSELNNLSIGSSFDLVVNDNTLTYKVVGLYDNASNEDQFESIMIMENTMYVTYDSINNYAEDAPLNVTYYINNINEFEQFKSDYLRITNKSEDEVLFKINDDVYNNSIRPLSSLNNLVGNIKWALLIVIMVIISSVLVINTKARNYEIGVFYAIGESKLRIIYQYIFENLIILSISFMVAVGVVMIIGKKSINYLINLDIFTNMNESSMMVRGMPGKNIASQIDKVVVDILPNYSIDVFVLNYIVILLITSLVAVLIILLILNKSTKDIINE